MFWGSCKKKERSIATFEKEDVYKEKQLETGPADELKPSSVHRHSGGCVGVQVDAFCFEAGQRKAADRLERGDRKLA